MQAWGWGPLQQLMVLLLLLLLASQRRALALLLGVAAGDGHCWQLSRQLQLLAWLQARQRRTCAVLPEVLAAGLGVLAPPGS